MFQSIIFRTRIERGDQPRGFRYMHNRFMSPIPKATACFSWRAFVGTCNFITRVMREIAVKRKSALAWKYANELHCNEVMLLPYYIASMNIEHEYLALNGDYQPFPGIPGGYVELAESEQAGFSFMSEGNTARVQRQKKSPITVIIGNPPYNMGQVNENDENKRIGNTVLLIRELPPRIRQTRQQPWETN